MSPDPLPPHDAPAMHYLVGGGIASLATAVLLIRDAGVPGLLIRIFEQSDSLGGNSQLRGQTRAKSATAGSDQGKILFSQEKMCENTVD